MSTQALSRDVPSIWEMAYPLARDVAKQEVQRPEPTLEIHALVEANSRQLPVTLP